MSSSQKAEKETGHVSLGKLLAIQYFPLNLQVKRGEKGEALPGSYF